MLNPLKWFKRTDTAAAPHGLKDRLKGYYALYEDQIVGWVIPPFSDVKGPLDVRFILRGQLVARCVGEPQPDKGRFLFRINRGPWLNPPDMLDGSLVVEAETNYGPSGTLLPDGPTQLRVIREYMDAPEDIAFDLSFGRDGNARPLLGAGWGTEEADATWTNAKESVISFDQPSIAGRLALRFSINPFLAPPDIPRQEANVMLNDEYIGSFALTSSELQSREIRFDSKILLTAPRPTLLLQHLFPGRPSDYGRSSKELRAFRFKRMRLVRVDVAAEG